MVPRPAPSCRQTHNQGEYPGRLSLRRPRNHAETRPLPQRGVRLQVPPAPLLPPLSQSQAAHRWPPAPVLPTQRIQQTDDSRQPFPAASSEPVPGPEARRIFPELLGPLAQRYQETWGKKEQDRSRQNRRGLGGGCYHVGHPRSPHPSLSPALAASLPTHVKAPTRPSPEQTQKSGRRNCNQVT